jgi:hypothetical protein
MNIIGRGSLLRGSRRGLIGLGLVLSLGLAPFAANAERCGPCESEADALASCRHYRDAQQRLSDGYGHDNFFYCVSGTYYTGAPSWATYMLTTSGERHKMLDSWWRSAPDPVDHVAPCGACPEVRCGNHLDSGRRQIPGRAGLQIHSVGIQ